MQYCVERAGFGRLAPLLCIDDGDMRVNTGGTWSSRTPEGMCALVSISQIEFGWIVDYRHHHAIACYHVVLLWLDSSCQMYHSHRVRD